MDIEGRSPLRASPSEPERLWSDGFAEERSNDVCRMKLLPHVLKASIGPVSTISSTC